MDVVAAMWHFDRNTDSLSSSFYNLNKKVSKWLNDCYCVWFLIFTHFAFQLIFMFSLLSYRASQWSEQNNSIISSFCFMVANKFWLKTKIFLIETVFISIVWLVLHFFECCALLSKLSPPNQYRKPLYLDINWSTSKTYCLVVYYCLK